MPTNKQTLAWAFLLVTLVHAQASTDVGQTSESYTTTTQYDGEADSNADVTTMYYTLCPDTTSTSSSSSTGTITAAPNTVSTVGDDGRITIYRTETTILPHWCPGGDGICGAIYTLTEECPCQNEHETTTEVGQCPDGFTTTVVECTVCAKNGGPATVTLTIPLPEGPYASVTPKYDTSTSHESTPEQTAIPSASSDSGDNKGNDSKCADNEGNAVNCPPPTQASSTAARWSNDEGSNSTTKPYTPTYKPYAGGASSNRLAIDVGGCMGVAAAALLGGLALML